MSFFFRMLLWVQNFLLVNPGSRQWTEKDTVYLVSFSFPQKTFLDNNIHFEKSMYDTTSKTSDKAPLDPEKFSSPSTADRTAVHWPTLLWKEGHPACPSLSSSPQDTESSSSPFLVGLGRETQTKAAPTATHTEQPSLLGFKSESPSRQGRAQGPSPQRGTVATQDWAFTVSVWIPICHIQAEHCYCLFCYMCFFSAG